MAFLDESGLQRYTDKFKEYVTRHLSTVDLTNYTTKTQVYDYVNESLADYITADDLNDYGFLTEVPSEYITDGELEEMGYATEDWVQGKGYLTEHQDISNLATKDEIPSLDEYIKSEDIGNITVSFTGTNNLDECTTLIEAILKLDSLITTQTT